MKISDIQSGIAAQEQVVYNLCLKLGIVLEDENT